MKAGGAPLPQIYIHIFCCAALFVWRVRGERKGGGSEAGDANSCYESAVIFALDIGGMFFCFNGKLVTLTSTAVRGLQLE